MKIFSAEQNSISYGMLKNRDISRFLRFEKNLKFLLTKGCESIIICKSPFFRGDERTLKTEQ